jgi:transposase
MQQRWTYRAYPTPEQKQMLARTFGCVRYVYNWGISERSRAFKDGRRMTYADTDRALTKLKQQPETIWLNDVHSVPLQQALRDLQSAYVAFFDKRSAYPSFKRRDGRQCARYTKSGFKLTDGRRLQIGKLGVLRLRASCMDSFPRRPGLVPFVVILPVPRHTLSFSVIRPTHSRHLRCLRPLLPSHDALRDAAVPEEAPPRVVNKPRLH